MQSKQEKVAVDAVDFANKSIGRDLRAKRVAAGLSQREVARRANMQPAVLCRLEKGMGNPTIATIKKVLKVIR